MRSRSTTQLRRSPERARAELRCRLEERGEEIEGEVLTRILSVSAEGEEIDAAYHEGLRQAVSAAVGYGLEAIELGDERSPPPPPILRAQARIGARAGVSLDTVLRRYFAGHALLGDFLVAEAQSANMEGAEIRRLLRAQATLFDRLLETVAEEHAKEPRLTPRSTERRRAEKVERLLAGEMVDASDLGYELDGHHVGIAARGEGAAEAIREVSRKADRSLLSVCREQGITWAWLGGRSPAEPAELLKLLAAQLPPSACLALGEPAAGLEGWRFSHRQAEAALAVARRGEEPVVRYADVALLASIVKDELLVSSLRRLYLEPLRRSRDGGEIALETLGAYFRSGCNLSSAAAALGVKRQTVANRLRAVENHIGRSLSMHMSEYEAALRLEELITPT